MLTVNRKFLTEIEICKACGRFTETRKITGDWVCFDCVAEGMASTYKGSSTRNIIRVKKTVDTAVKKEKQVKNKKPKIKNSKIKKFESCKKFLRKLFLENPNKLFKSIEIYEFLENRFDQRNVSNYLSLMAKEGFIYTRRINLTGTNYYSLCSRNQALVNQLVPEETAYKYREYIIKHAPISTVELSTVFNTSFKSVSSTVSAKLLDTIGIEKVGNKNYYYPLKRKDEMLSIIHKLR